MIVGLSFFYVMMSYLSLYIYIGSPRCIMFTGFIIMGAINVNTITVIIITTTLEYNRTIAYVILLNNYLCVCTVIVLMSHGVGELL